ncbi:MAG: FAD-dependent thymidylate synthase [Bacillota bacterium]
MGQTTPKVALITHTINPELAVALGAKLCYSKSDLAKLQEKLAKGDVDAFIAKIMGMGHLSTIEHSSFTFAIEGVSRALLAQITRHRIASFSVQSQRYVPASVDFSYIIPPKILALGDAEVEKFKAQMTEIGGYYKYWQEKLGGGGEGANEDARFVLPNSAETKMLVTMNSRELLHFFRLRCCNRAQWEIREVAWMMLEKVVEVAPAIFGLSGPACVGGKCPEGEKCCGCNVEMKNRMNALKEACSK